MSVILIAGGATGIGRASLDDFRRDGHDVFLVDINQAESTLAVEQSFPGRAKAFICDLAQEQAATESVAAAIAEYGQLDTLFVNAAVLHSAPLAEWTASMWNRSMAINLSAPFFMAQAAAPYLAKSSNASIIFTSSTGALRGHAGMPAYHATKAGLLGLCRSLADELSPSGIRVNCVLPGWIDTAFNDPFWAFQQDREQASAALDRQIPSRRQGEPSDVTGVVRFLASPSSRYVTGTSIIVDGGYSAV